MQASYVGQMYDDTPSGRTRSFNDHNDAIPRDSSRRRRLVVVVVVSRFNGRATFAADRRGYSPIRLLIRIFISSALLFSFKR